METLGRFSDSFDKGEDFCDFLFAFRYTSLFLKGVYSKNKEFAPRGGSKVFPFRVDPSSEVSKTILTGLSPLTVYQFLLNDISANQKLDNKVFVISCHMLMK